MRVLFTDKGISFQKYGGVSRYFCEMIKRLMQKPEVRCDIGALFFDNFYFSELYDEKSLRHYKPVWKFGKLINRLYSVCLYVMNKYDIVHHTYYNLFPEYFYKKCKHVVTIHDMIPEMGLLDDKEAVKRKKQYIYSSDHIVAVSECTKNDILRIYPDISPKKITVIYHGADLDKKSGGSIELPTRYILYVGQRLQYKNFDNFLLAYSKLLERHQQVLLVCFGGGAFSPKEKERIEELGLSEFVKYVSGNDKELAAAYTNAECFVYPSKYEGFGIPILEAWSCECPVVLSNASCFPEIAGNAAKYFDPDSSEDMALVIGELLDNKEKRKDLKKLGSDRLKEYSWEIAAQKTLDVYRSLLES